MPPGDPVECPACGQMSAKMYRCQHCGRDLAGEGSTEGRERVE
jgi:ribosomal protein L37AE/L43A